jgi:hypothetical protein
MLLYHPPSSTRRICAIDNHPINSTMPRRRIGVASIHSRVEVVGAVSASTRPVTRYQRRYFDPSGFVQYGPSSLDAINTLFSTPDPRAQQDEHTMKRRKTDHDSAVNTLQADSDEQPSIVLAKICLDLVSIDAVPAEYVAERDPGLCSSRPRRLCLLHIYPNTETDQCSAQASQQNYGCFGGGYPQQRYRNSRKPCC